MSTWSCRVCWLNKNSSLLTERRIVYIIALLVLQSMPRTWLFDVLLDCGVEKEGYFSRKEIMMVTMNLSWVLQGYRYHAPEFFSDCKHLGQIFILFETVCLLISVCLIITVDDKCHLSYLGFLSLSAYSVFMKQMC